MEASKAGMILEAIKYLSTPCRPEFRKLGYLHEIVGLQAREKRQHQRWEPHHRKCQDLIRRAVELCPYRRRVIVLGSGLLEDIPLEYLHERFNEIVLVDVIHLKEVRQRVALFPKVQLFEEDISGLALPLAAMKRKPRALPEPHAVIPELNHETDLIISANLLSQLCLVPLNYAVAKFSFSDEEYIEWCRLIIQDHVNVLLASGARVCLISDLVHVESSRQGKEIRREDMLFGISLPDAAVLWDWELAPLGEVSHSHSVSAVVSGFVNFPYPGE